MNRLLKPIFAAAAVAPPALKRTQLYRVVSYFYRHCDATQFGAFETNLGMASSLRVRIPAASAAFFIFGTPRHYKGEFGTMELCRHLSVHADAFVDIGANLGYFSFYVRATSKNRNLPIYLFEPNRTLLEGIEANVRRNGLKDVHCFAEAVSNEVGTADFHIMEDSLQSSLIPSPHDASTLTEVPVTTFDVIANRHGLQKALVKVDVENAEFQFLAGAEKTHAKISYLVTEVLIAALKQGFISAAKEKIGMNAFYINDSELCFSKSGEFEYRQSEYNWLFCRETAAELRALLEPFGFKVRG